MRKNRVYLNLFFVNPERVPEGLPQCENGRGLNTFIERRMRDNIEEVESFLKEGYGYYEQMGKTEEVWVSLSLYSDKTNPDFRLTQNAIKYLAQMNASLNFDVYIDSD